MTRGSRSLALCAVGLLGGCPSAPPVVPPDYVPSEPFAYDGRYLDGSFEQAQGFGWDTCRTRSAGTLEEVTSGSASQGAGYLTFESAGGCSLTCASANPSSSQVYVWFSKSTNTSAAMGLYFDVRSGMATPPMGTLSFYGTDTLCEQESLLAAIPLDELEPWSDWSTRCVDVLATGAHAAIGVAVTGRSFRIGLDALRLGPPCHGDL